MPHIVRFDRFEVDLESGQLRSRGTKIKLRDQSFRVLDLLLKRPGCVVTREELRQRLWGDEVFVDFDNNVNILIARLRQALGDSAEHPKFIETLPKHGYRFLAAVTEPHAAEPAAVPRARLIVLPFLNLSGDPAQEYFSDAMTDEMITALASVAPEQVAVIARTTAMHYKGTHKDVGRIGRELSADYVVEGGARRTDDQVAINVQLIQTSDQTHLFAKRYDSAMRDLFNMHNRIAEGIVGHIHGVSRLTPPHQFIRRKTTESITAYNEYIKGRYEFFKLTPESMPKARQHFETALARDPGFALACNALAEFYWYVGFWGFTNPRTTDPVGRSYLLRAIEADHTLADTHALLSFYPKKCNNTDEFDYYNWGEMQKDIARARDLDPTSHIVRIRYAIIVMMLGRTEEAASELELALESDPLSLDARVWYAVMLCLGRRYDRALEHCLQTVELEPENFMPYYVLGMIYLAMQKFDESLAALRRAAEISHELPLMLGLLGLSLGSGGHSEEARIVLDRLHSLSGQRYVPPTCFAWTHLGLGEIDDAFVWMDRAIDAPDRMIKPIKTYPFLDPLRDDPRFDALLRKMNLAA